MHKPHWKTGSHSQTTIRIVVCSRWSKVSSLSKLILLLDAAWHQTHFLGQTRHRNCLYGVAKRFLGSPTSARLHCSMTWKLLALCYFGLRRKYLGHEHGSSCRNRKQMKSYEAYIYKITTCTGMYQVLSSPGPCALRSTVKPEAPRRVTTAASLVARPEAAGCYPCRVDKEEGH